MDYYSYLGEFNIDFTSDEKLVVSVGTRLVMCTLTIHYKSFLDIPSATFPLLLGTSTAWKLDPKLLGANLWGFMTLTTPIY